MSQRTLTPLEAREIASESYAYLYPLVLMEAFRQNWDAPTNHFSSLTAAKLEQLGIHARPVACAASVGAWLDLSGGPVVVILPDSHRRHLVATAIDAWGEVFSAIGSRHCGSGGGRFVFVGPNWSGECWSVADFATIRAPTSRVWIAIHFIAAREADMAGVRHLARLCTAAPLKPSKQTTPATPRLGFGISPHMQVATLDPEHFLTCAAALLRINPPRRKDAHFLNRLRNIGVIPAWPFELNEQTPQVAEAIIEGATLGRANVLAEHDRHLQTARQTWTGVQNIASSYLDRAAWARWAPANTHQEELLRLHLISDANGENLSGSRNYRLHFPAGRMPPAHAFWSLFTIDHAVNAPIRTLHNFTSDRQRLTYNADGSLDLHLTSRPADGRMANYLLCPRKRFDLVLELISPRAEALNGTWSPPKIERARRAGRFQAAERRSHRGLVEVETLLGSHA
ncbi:MAG: DUF1254 domain-containing protein [Pseudomonadota bacterium]